MASKAQITQKIQDNFNASAEDYRSFEQDRAFFQGLLRSLLALAPEKAPENILDVGCGTGAGLSLLMERARGRVFGVDNAKEMIALARRSHPGAELRVLDAASLHMLGELRFDWIVYNAVYFMLAQASESLAGARARLKPGGTLLMSNLRTLTLDSSPISEEVAKITGRAGGRHNLVDTGEIEDSLKPHFETVLHQELAVELELDTFQRFYSIQAMSAGLAPYLPYPARMKLVQELVERCQRQALKPVQRWQLLAGINHQR